jgi:hypothetical protein
MNKSKKKTNVYAPTLENAFFNKKENELVELINNRNSRVDVTKRLSEISGIENPSVLNIALELGITEKTFSALSLIPLLKVAWADHEIDVRELKSLFKAVREINLEEESLSYKLFESWLEKEINPNLFVIWESYIGELKQKLSQKKFDLLRKEILRRCKYVARASGGFLGIRAISKGEDNVIRRIENAFVIRKI